MHDPPYFLYEGAFLAHELFVFECFLVFRVVNLLCFFVLKGYVGEEEPSKIKKKHMSFG